MAYTSSQVSSINAARAANVAAGINAYSGAGATASSIASGSSGAGATLPSQNVNNPNVAFVAPDNVAPLLSNVIQAPNIGVNNPESQKINFGSFESILNPANYTGITNSLSTNNPDGTPKSVDTQLSDAQSNASNNQLSLLMKQMTEPLPSSADAFKKAQNETGILQKQQLVGDLTGQLNQIVATSQTQQIAETAQGRGIPETIIGGRQAQIAREAAILALPVAAQLSAAQGNLAMAESNMNMLFKIYSDDATNAYNRKNKMYDAFSAILGKQDQNKIDALQKQSDRAYTEGEANRKASQEMIINAFSQGAPTSATTKALDAVKKGESSMAVAKTLGVYAGDFLGNEAKRASTAASNASAANSRASADKTRAEMNTSQTVGGKITNPEYAGVINTILGSGKYTKEQSNAIRNAINNGEDPFIVIKNQAKGLMSGANQTKVESYETAKGALTDINSSLKEFYAKGGKTNIFNGNYEKTFNKLGEVKDPKLVNLAVQIQTNLQVYRNAVSGTAYSEQEGKDIASIFPGINKSEGLNTAIMSGRMRAFDSTIDSTYRGTLGSTYDKLKSLNTTQATSGSTPTTSGSTPSGNTWSIPNAWGKINNGQGVTTSGFPFTIIP